MEIYDFMDMEKLQELQDQFSDATGLAAIAVDSKGEYMTEGSNFTDFCMKYTRGSAEGNRRCIKCDNECTGTYFCHAGLMDFAFDIVVDGERLGAMIGGQVLPNEPDEEKFRATAEELGIDPEIITFDAASSSVESGVEMGRKILQNGYNFTAVFASTDSNAIGLMQAARETGIHIPEEISLIGFDNIRISALPQIDLTTVAQPKEEMAVSAVDMLMKKIETGSKTFTHKIIKLLF